jgi:hypothetical protein
MTNERWRALMDNDDLPLTAEEIAGGWHFCWEWDGLLVGPEMEEWKFCQEVGGCPFARPAMWPYLA